MASISVVSRMPRGRSESGAADGDPARGRHSGVFIVKAGAISPPALGGGRDTPRVSDISTFVPTQRVALALALAGKRFSLVRVSTVSRHEASLEGASVFDPELATLARHRLKPPCVSRETSPLVRVPMQKHRRSLHYPGADRRRIAAWWLAAGRVIPWSSAMLQV